MNIFDIHVSEKSIELVTEVLHSTWLNEGEYVRQLESGLTETLGLLNPVTVNSCTSALHLSLVCAGVQPGDEVILPPQTFIATGTAILQAHAIPVFADINPNTGNLDPNKIKEKITEKTKAVIPVHWGGMPCNIPAIHAVCDGLTIIEDAAHALGASIDNKPIGAWSKYTCFSFQTVKFLTAGDGGCITTTDLNVYEELNRRKWFGFDRHRMKRNFEGDRDYLVTELGFKYHMNNITAAIALGNLYDIPERLITRQYIGNRYRTELTNVPGVTLLHLPDNYQHAYWLFTMLVENRKDFIRALADQEIPASVIDRRIDAHPIFTQTELPGQELFDAKQISIPVHDKLTDDDVDLIIQTIQKGW